MSKHGVIRRYILLIEKIGKKQFPSFDDLKEFLSDHGFRISSRTLQRDMEQIRFEFGLEIEYNHLKNGYFFNFEKSLNLDSFFRFLEIVNTAHLLTEKLLLKHQLFLQVGSVVTKQKNGSLFILGNQRI